MNIIYHPSSRQAKDLLIRGTEINLALPAPPGDLDDPIDWAKSVLPLKFAALVVAAEEREIFVRAQKSTLDDSLTSHLGPIDDPDRVLCVLVVVVVVTLRPADHRHTSSVIQWPRQAVCNGITIPAEIEGSE